MPPLSHRSARIKKVGWFISLNRSSWLVLLLLALSSSLVGSRKLSETPLTWSVKSLEQTLYPEAETTLTETFRSDRAIEMLKLTVTGEIASHVRINPTKLANIKPKQDYKVTFTFSAGQRDQKSLSGLVNVVATYNKVALSEPTPAPLPISLRVDSSVEQRFKVLCAQLLSKSFGPKELDMLVSKFVRADRDRMSKFFLGLDYEGRVRQANVFKNARLVYGTDDYQVYKSTWQDKDGTSSEVEFALALVESGKNNLQDSGWLIISW